MLRLHLYAVLAIGGIAAAATACTTNTVIANGTPQADPDDAGAPVSPALPDAGNSDNGDTGAAVTTLDPRFFDGDPIHNDPIFTQQNPDPAKVDVDALDALMKEAVTQKSDSVIVALGDTIIAEKYFGHVPGPATIQSITKSVVSLEVGALITDKKIASLDEPISTWYPEWATGDKATATLRHVLAHTSGLVDDGIALFEQKDALAYARAQPLTTVPGESFAYSNTGAMLLAGIVKQAGGADADILVRDRFLTPLGITQWSWGKDPAGNVMTPGGLFLAPRDLLRLGRLVRENGSWNGKSILAPSWITDSTTSASSSFACYALQWWLIRDNCNSSTGLVGTAGAIEGTLADGWGGNYIAVIPKTHIVAVRTKQPADSATFEEEEKTAFEAFPHEIAVVVAK